MGKKSQGTACYPRDLMVMMIIISTPYGLFNTEIGSFVNV